VGVGWVGVGWVQEQGFVLVQEQAIAAACLAVPATASYVYARVKDRILPVHRVTALPRHRVTTSPRHRVTTVPR